MKLSEDPTVPTLEGWVNLTEAAQLLGITRQHGYKMAKSKKFKTLHKVGNQPAYVISLAEINTMIAQRALAKEATKESEETLA